MGDLLKEKVKIHLGDGTVELDYTMASIYYLAEKYTDLSTIFQRKDGINKEYVTRIADVVYAGLLKLDDEGKPVSEWTLIKVMNALHMDQLSEIVEAFMQGMAFAMPQRKADTGEEAEEQDPPEAVNE